MNYTDLIEWAEAAPGRTLLFYAVTFVLLYLVLAFGARAAQWWMDWHERRRDDARPRDTWWR